MVGDFVIGRRGRRYASLVALLAAVGIGLMTFASDGWFVDREVSLRPNLLSTIAAILMVSALYARRILEWSPSVYSILSLVLNIFVTAALMRAILGAGAWSLTGLAMPYLVIFAIILTWVGLRPLAPVIWLLVVMAGVINLQIVSEAMGLWGYLFIVLVTFGVLMQLEANLKNVLPELRHDFAGTPSAAAALEAPQPVGTREIA